MATPIANPVIVLGLDSAPLSKGLSGAVSMASSYGKKIAGALSSAVSSVGSSVAKITGSIGKSIGSGVLGAVSGTASTLSGMFTVPIKAMATLNQAMGFIGKIGRAAQNFIQPVMEGEARSAQFVGTGNIDIATSSTFTGVLGRFQNQVEDTFADIANSLDSIFNIKEKLEWFRGAIAAIGAIFSGLAQEFGSKRLDPKALSQSFKDGANATINAFETAAKIAVQITNSFVRMLNAIDAKAKILGVQDALAGGIAGAGEFLGLLPKGIGKELQADIQRGLAARQAAKFAEIDEARIGRIANAARMAIGQPNNQNDLERKALEWRDRIGGLKPIDVQSRIAPFLGSGTAQLEEALVKARLQAEGGDIQQRIEAAMREQIEIEKGQVNVLNAIKTVIQNKPGFLNVVGG